MFKTKHNFIQSFQLIYKFASHLNAVPSYNFNKRILDDTVFRRYSVIIFGCLVVILMVYSLYLRTSIRIIANTKISIIVLELMHGSISIFSYVTLVFCTRLRKAMIWKKILNTIQIIDSHLKLCQEKKNIEHKIWYRIVIMHILYFSSGVILLISVSLTYNGKTEIFLYIFQGYAMYLLFYITTIMSLIIVVLNFQCCMLNKNFKSSFINKSKHTIKLDRVYIIRTTGKIYRLLGTAADSFNLLFGVLILGLLGNALINFIAVLNFSMLSSTFELDKTVITSLTISNLTATLFLNVTF